MITTVALRRMREKFRFTREGVDTASRKKRSRQEARSTELPLFSCGELLGCDCAVAEDDETETAPRVERF